MGCCKKADFNNRGRKTKQQVQKEKEKTSKVDMPHQNQKSTSVAMSRVGTTPKQKARAVVVAPMQQYLQEQSTPPKFNQ